jgi:ubiquinone/menaquinone biosynthesis C-methylase UbiE
MIYKYLPYFIFKPLFGDRKKWGLQTDINDKDFRKWQDECYLKFYQENQKGGMGTLVNHFGFKIMEKIDLTDKIILEVGPGSIDHLDYNQTIPHQYILADINKDFLDISTGRLYEYGITNVKTKMVKGIEIELENDSVDILITFHQLEHIYKLDEYLNELKRILKPGGILVGAVPAEGGGSLGIWKILNFQKICEKKYGF